MSSAEVATIWQTWQVVVVVLVLVLVLFGAFQYVGRRVPLPFYPKYFRSKANPLNLTRLVNRLCATDTHFGALQQKKEIVTQVFL